MIWRPEHEYVKGIYRRKTHKRIGISAAKKWRYGRGLVLRLSDTVEYNLPIGGEFSAASASDHLEREVGPLPLQGQNINLIFKTREIITLIVYRR